MIEVYLKKRVRTCGSVLMTFRTRCFGSSEDTYSRASFILQSIKEPRRNHYDVMSKRERDARTHI